MASREEDKEEEKPLVAFLGPKATYTHQAALSHFPSQNYTHLSLPTIESIFHSVQSQQTPHGVVPFENSSNGPVGFTLDLFADHADRFKDVIIEAEVYLPVSHCLVGHSPSSPTSTAKLTTANEAGTGDEATNEDFSHIKKLYSHPQAWTQCSHFLSANFPSGIEQIDVSSTSRAAELVAQDSTGTSAAISSRIAAEVNDLLPILAEGIEDVRGNTTRFFVLRHLSSSSSSSLSSPSVPSPSPSPSSAPAPAAGEKGDGSEEENHKSLISFRLKQNQQSGSLAESLGVFARYGVNLTSILSRPSREAAWHYVFFVEVHGRPAGREQGGEGEGERSNVDEALEELGKVVEGWRWLGSWVDRRR